jgi:hypothetical protein
MGMVSQFPLLVLSISSSTTVNVTIEQGAGVCPIYWSGTGKACKRKHHQTQLVVIKHVYGTCMLMLTPLAPCKAFTNEHSESNEGDVQPDSPPTHV